MYATGVATVVQALSNEVAYISAENRWVALNTWSCSAPGEARHTIKILQKILRSGTRHKVFLNSHFFNIEDIEVNTYRNNLNDIANAVTTLKKQDNHSNRTPSLVSQMNVARAKQRSKLDPLSNITHITSVGMAALTDKSIKRGRHSSSQISQGTLKRAQLRI